MALHRLRPVYDFIRVKLDRNLNEETTDVPNGYK